MNWVKITDKPFPKDQAGTYLIWLNKEWMSSNIHCYIITKIANGFMGIVGSSFDFDVLGDKDDDFKIVAWMDIPEYKEDK